MIEFANGYTPKRFVDKIVEFLPAAGRCTVDPGDGATCSYVNAQGSDHETRCAAGAFLSPAFAAAAGILQGSWVNLLSGIALEFGDEARAKAIAGMPFEGEYALQELQRAHDRSGDEHKNPEGGARAAVLQWAAKDVEGVAEELAQRVGPRELARLTAVLVATGDVPQE